MTTGDLVGDSRFCVLGPPRWYDTGLCLDHVEGVVTVAKIDRAVLVLVILVTLAAAVFFTNQWVQCTNRGGAYVESINSWPKCVEVR